MTPQVPRDNRRGGLWLVADMSLNIWALSLVKWLDADYPATQIVLMRALVGLTLILPLIWRHWGAFRHIEQLRLHVLRVGFSAVTLTASFFAISRIPLALFTTLNFTRPVVTMILAALVLNEAIGRRRWIAAIVAFGGVYVAANPGAVSWSSGLAAALLVVVTGSAAIIVTRRLRSAPSIVLMTFYTAGLALCMAPFAFISWVPVQPDHRMALLGVGAFSQCAQLCFLRAHFHGDAGFLSVVGYLSLVLSTTVGIVVFREIPGPEFAIGAIGVIAAALWVASQPEPAAPRKR